MYVCWGPAMPLGSQVHLALTFNLQSILNVVTSINHQSIFDQSSINLRMHARPLAGSQVRGTAIKSSDADLVVVTGWALVPQKMRVRLLEAVQVGWQGDAGGWMWVGEVVRAVQVSGAGGRCGWCRWCGGGSKCTYQR